MSVAEPPQESTSPSGRAISAPLDVVVTRTIRNRLLVIGLLATLGFVAVADLFIGTFNWPAALCGLVNLVGAAVWTHILRDYLVRVVLA